MLNQDKSKNTQLDFIRKEGQSRLPCRGCTPNCQYLTRCNGKPWRLNQEIALTKD